MSKGHKHLFHLLKIIVSFLVYIQSFWAHIYQNRPKFEIFFTSSQVLDCFVQKVNVTSPQKRVAREKKRRQPPALPKNTAGLKSFLYVEKIACYLKHWESIPTTSFPKNVTVQINCTCKCFLSTWYVSFDILITNLLLLFEVIYIQWIKMHSQSCLSRCTLSNSCYTKKIICWWRFGGKFE